MTTQINPFRVLSIDGGGIKGLYTARILQQFEEEFKCRIAEKFDLICGTSTGGIIALALSIGIPAAKLVDFYKIDGPKIFPYTTKLSRHLIFWQQLLFQSKYGSGELKKALEAVFGDKRMKDASCLLCIPSFNVSTGENRVFKKDHSDLVNDNNLLMVDVALATSAAPTYFPLHKLEKSYYVDGGIWANNPSLCGVREGVEYFLDNTYDSIKLLSIASLTDSHGFHLKKQWYHILNYKRWSFRDWGSNLFELTLDGQSEFVNFFMATLKKSSKIPIDYERISSHDIPCKNASEIGLDKATRTSIELYELLGQKQGLMQAKRPQIKKFFQP